MVNAIKYKDIKYYIYIFICFFPFLSILRLQTDSQPNALIFSIIILAFNFKFLYNNLPKIFLYLLLFLSITTIILMLSKINKDVLLSYIVYISLLLIPFTVYITLLRINGLKYIFYKYCVYIWFVVGFVQKYFLTSFLSFLTYRSAGSNFMGRGVASLSPEPTFYGTICLLLLVIYLINFSSKNDYFIIILIGYQLVFLSISTTVLILLIGSFFIFILTQLTKLKVREYGFILFFLLILIAQYYIFFDFWEKTRFYTIMNLILENPELILIDQSINERINHAFFPIMSLFDNYGLPHQFGTFPKYIEQKINTGKYDIFFKDVVIEHYTRIMNVYGSIFYDLGIIGLILPYSVYKLFKGISNTNYLKFAFIIFTLILFTAISLNNSLLLFIIGNLIYLYKNNKINVAN
jgi:hypothetical protein